MRVLNAGSDSESYMYGFLNQYFREAFRQTKTATGLLDVVFTAVSS